MRRAMFAILALAALCGLAIAADPAGPDVPEDPRLAFLKSLEGTWIATSGGGELHDGIFEYRVTSGGSAVEERLMADSPKEMLTVYHMNGKDLVATHYCMLGNQPRFKASRRFEVDALEFECDGKVSNTASHDEQHIHSWSMNLEDDGKLYFTATMVKDGEIVQKPDFVLARE